MDIPLNWDETESKMKQEEIRFGALPKPELENVKEIEVDTEEFKESNKAKAIIKHLGLSVGLFIRENHEYFTINPKMVLEGSPPEHYKDTIENIKKILTPEEIKQISNYIRRKKEDDKVKDKIYHSITKRTDKFYWRGNIKKSLSEEITTILDFFKKDFHGVNNTIYHLLSKDKDDYIRCYKLAWLDKPIPNIQTWRETHDGEYMVLTDSEADERVEDYLDEDQWKQAVECGNTTEGFYEWCKTVISHDGRGSLLGGYDGCEDDQEIDGEDYYIYRTN